MFKHLLVPLDGSPLAEVALPAACELADHFNGKITLLRVARTPYIASGLDGITYAELIINLRQQEYDEAMAYLQMRQRALCHQGYLVEKAVRQGEQIAEVILATAQEIGADAVVMSTHGRGGVSRWVFGSVADRVLRQSAVPVLLIRAREKVNGAQLVLETAETSPATI